ncbi:ccr4 associated factor [Malassezia vespertilionis]|uniref:Caf17p n=1 Tax=Malassezia vespertilionis TaxID=2020962 RepID=A0A2N1J8Q2_9BASI|nr:ccr4 associated factor [Malassezia vespertilionis]PKI82842.1 Caf17p [Malassezia vespertilionis]WFD08370.1 ccr4 associated factor [Malassezia vespertilionis]
MLQRARQSVLTRALSTAARAPLCVAPVPFRGLYALEGRDTFKFLQGCMTNNVTTLERCMAEPPALAQQYTFYTGFLNPQGRVIADAFLHLVPGAQEPSVLLEADTRVMPELIKFLRRFKLRSKFRMQDVSDDWQVMQVWGARHAPDHPAVAASEALIYKDIRAPTMGWRVLVLSSKTPPQLPEMHVVSAEEYTVHRMLCGVPEGPDEIIPNSSLPLESCMDYMHGGTLRTALTKVDFRKGCYIGQELTARTYFTGLTRKRVMPFMLTHIDSPRPTQVAVESAWQGSAPKSGSDLRFNLGANAGDEKKNARPARTRSAGRYLSGIHNLGLGLLRLEQVDKTHEDDRSFLSVQATEDQPLRVTPWTPDWWPEANDTQAAKDA